MDQARVLRALTRHPVLVSAGVCVAVLAGVFTLYAISPFPPRLTSRQVTSGEATARVLIAARNRPTTDLRSRVADTLPMRAELLADLLATDDRSAEIARGAGLAATDLIVLAPAMGAPKVPIPIATSATDVARRPIGRYVVTLTTEGARIPIITVTSAGPDPRTAGRVAESARARLDEVIRDQAPLGRAADLEARRLGPAVGRTVTSGPHVVAAPVAAALVLLLWCFAIVVLSGLAASRRVNRRSRLTPARSR